MNLQATKNHHYFPLIQTFGSWSNAATLLFFVWSPSHLDGFLNRWGLRDPWPVRLIDRSCWLAGCCWRAIVWARKNGVRSFVCQWFFLMSWWWLVSQDKAPISMVGPDSPCIVLVNTVQSTYAVSFDYLRLLYLAGRSVLFSLQSGFAKLWTNQIGFMRIIIDSVAIYLLQAQTRPELMPWVVCMVWLNLGCYGLVRFLLIDGLWRWTIVGSGFYGDRRYYQRCLVFAVCLSVKLLFGAFTYMLKSENCPNGAPKT